MLRILYNIKQQSKIMENSKCTDSTSETRSGNLELNPWRNSDEGNLSLISNSKQNVGCIL